MSRSYKEGSPGGNRKEIITLSKLKKTLQALQSKDARKAYRNYYKKQSMLGKVK